MSEPPFIAAIREALEQIRGEKPGPGSPLYRFLLVTEAALDGYDRDVAEPDPDKLRHDGWT